MLITALLGARFVSPESLGGASTGFTAELGGGPTPAITAFADSLLATLAAIALIVVRPRERSSPWLRAGVVFLVLAAVVSSAAANDHRAAMNASADLVAVVLAAGALARLMSRRWMIAAVLSTILAAQTANAAKCLIQKQADFAETLAYWEKEQKPELIRRGYDADDPMIVNYERRLRSGESFGYLFHPNVAGGGLAVGGVIALGLAVALWPRRRENAASIVLAWAICGLCVAGLATTGSVGAYVAAAGGFVLVLGMGIFRSFVQSRARTVLLLLATGYVGVAGLGAAYGLTKGTLPHTSLAFRWDYWTAGIKGYLEQPLTGMGRENFLAAYLRYRKPESTEEVRDPHDVWITALAELGPLGLAAALLLVGGVVACAGRALRGAGAETSSSEPAMGGFARAAPIVVLLPVFQAWLSQTQLLAAGGSLLIVWLAEFVVIWLLAFAAAWSMLAARSERDAYGLAAAALAGFVVILTHAMVDMSLTVPSALSLAALVAAVLIAVGRGVEAESPVAKVRAVGARHADAGALVVTVLVLFALVAWPSVAADRELRAFRARLARPEFLVLPAEEIAGAAEPLIAADRWSADAPRFVASVLVASAEHAADPKDAANRLDVAARFAYRACERSPGSANAWRSRAHIEAARAALVDEDTDDAVSRLRTADTSWTRALELYPTDPRLWVEAGQTREEIWEQTRQDADAARAIEAYRAALRIDATRPDDVAVKLRGEERAAIQASLDLLTP